MHIKVTYKHYVQNKKQGANPEMANMNLKRYIVFSEPEATEKIHNSIMKELTGNARINARKLYENKCDVIIPATIVLECNDKIILKNDSTDGEVRRIINYTYKSKFTKDVNEVNAFMKQFEQMKQMMGQMNKMKGMGMPGMMPGRR